MGIIRIAANVYAVMYVDYKGQMTLSATLPAMGSTAYTGVVWVGAPHNHFVALMRRTTNSGQGPRKYTISKDLINWTPLQDTNSVFNDYDFRFFTTPKLSSRIFGFEYDAGWYSDDGGANWVQDSTVMPSSQYCQFENMPHAIWVPQYQKYFAFNKTSRVISCSDGLTWQTEFPDQVVDRSESSPLIYDTYRDKFIFYNHSHKRLYFLDRVTPNQRLNGVAISKTGSTEVTLQSTFDTWTASGVLSDYDDRKVGRIWAFNSDGTVGITPGGMPANITLETDPEPTGKFLSYVETDGSGNVTGFANSPKPVFINDGSNTNTIQFPSMIGSSSPDTQLPPGSTLNVEVNAYTAGGFSETLTDNVTPS